MKIKVLGTGCRKCRALEEAARTAVAELGVEAEFEKITDIKDYDVRYLDDAGFSGERKSGRIGTSSQRR